MVNSISHHTQYLEGAALPTKAAGALGSNKAAADHLLSSSTASALIGSALLGINLVSGAYQTIQIRKDEARIAELERQTEASDDDFSDLESTNSGDSIEAKVQLAPERELELLKSSVTTRKWTRGANLCLGAAGALTLTKTHKVASALHITKASSAIATKVAMLILAPLGLLILAGLAIRETGKQITKLEEINHALQEPSDRNNKALKKARQIIVANIIKNIALAVGLVLAAGVFAGVLASPVGWAAIALVGVFFITHTITYGLTSQLESLKENLYPRSRLQYSTDETSSDSSALMLAESRKTENTGSKSSQILSGCDATFCYEGSELSE